MAKTRLIMAAFMGEAFENGLLYQPHLSPNVKYANQAVEQLLPTLPDADTALRFAQQLIEDHRDAYHLLQYLYYLKFKPERSDASFKAKHLIDWTPEELQQVGKQVFSTLTEGQKAQGKIQVMAVPFALGLMISLDEDYQALGCSSGSSGTYTRKTVPQPLPTQPGTIVKIPVIFTLDQHDEFLNQQNVRHELRHAFDKVFESVLDQQFDRYNTIWGGFSPWDKYDLLYQRKIHDPQDFRGVSHDYALKRALPRAKAELLVRLGTDGPSANFSPVTNGEYPYYQFLTQEFLEVLGLTTTTLSGSVLLQVQIEALDTYRHILINAVNTIHLLTQTYYLVDPEAEALLSYILAQVPIENWRSQLGTPAALRAQKQVLRTYLDT